MSRNRYWECTSCKQVVQGFNAMQDIDCCEGKHMVEIKGPEQLDGVGQDNPDWNNMESIDGFPI